MADFANPFSGNEPRKITKEELIQAIRINIAAEMEAAFLYDAHSRATDIPLAKEVLADIRDEEMVHAGELLELLKQLDPEAAKHFEEGAGEVREEMEKLKKKKK